MKFFVPIGVLLLMLTSCQQGDDIQPNMIDRGKLISYEVITTISVEEINDLYQEQLDFEGDISDLPTFDITLYRIIYQSMHDGAAAELSGLIVVPNRIGSLPHLQYHHGTMFPYPYPYGEGSEDAPSLYTGQPTNLYTEYDKHAEVRIFGNYLGSYGYLVSLPDYAGYGHSSDLEHPYSVNSELANNSVDMIIATRAFCTALNIELNDQLFLSGWSEGAAGCLATQKLIEAEYENQLQVTGNAPLAGFYNFAFYGELLINALPAFNVNMGEDLDVILWALYALNTFSDNPIPNDVIYKYDVFDQLDVLENRPSSNPSQLLKGLSSSVKEQIVQSFRKESLAHAWTPIAPVFLHHGTDDDIVYYANNAELTEHNLNNLGGEVHLYSYEGHDHYSLVMLYLLKMIEDFEEL